MEQSQAANPIPPKKRMRLPGLGWLLDNPVIMKELRGRMRDRRTFILLVFYLLLISSFVGMVYLLMGDSYAGVTFSPDYRQTMGKSIFGTVVLIELLLVSFIGPGLTAGAITSEREHRTLDLLKTTLLTTRELVFGKLGAAVIYLFLLIFTVMPIQSLAFILGGVGLAEVAISSVMLVVTAIFFASLGLFFSSLLKRTLAATVSAYGSILISVFSFIFFLFMLTSLISLSYSGNPLSSLHEDILTVIIWMTISTNPLLAAVFTEVILIEQQSIFMSSSSMIGSSSFGMLSPWIIYVATYTTLTIIVVLISIALVKRPER
jgi:ABC-type transport system involved in multi-copper enzyme maturation permease subunit